MSTKAGQLHLAVLSSPAWVTVGLKEGLALQWPRLRAPEVSTPADDRFDTLSALAASLGKRARRLRFDRFLAQSQAFVRAGIAIAIAVGSAAALRSCVGILAALASGLRNLVLVGVVVAAVVVFRLLGMVFDPRQAWLVDLHQQVTLLSAKEEFDLAWAFASTPIKQPLTHEDRSAVLDHLRASDSPETAIRALRDASFALERGIRDQRAHDPRSGPRGGVRVLVRDVEQIRGRAFTLGVGDREVRYEGTASAALILPPGVKAHAD